MEKKNAILSLKSFLFLSFFILPNLVFPSLVLAKGWNDFNSAIKKSRFKAENLSIWVGDGDKELFALNASKLRRPASLAKILTAGSVLSLLAYQKLPETCLYADKKPEGSTLNSNIYFVGDGDPYFTSESLSELSRSLAVRTPIRRINGSIVIDTTKFKDSRVLKKSVTRAYESYATAASLNWNVVTVFVQPSSGSRPKVVYDPPSDYPFKIKNSARMKSGSSRKISLKMKNNVITVTGRMGRSAKDEAFFVPVSSPIKWVGHGLKAFLAKEGVHISGDISEANSPAKYRHKLICHKGRPLEESVKGMIKFSNNNMASTLGSLLGVERKRQASLGLDVIAGWTKKVLGSKDYKGIRLVDASGLSKRNQINSRQLAAVLNHLSNDFRTGALFESTLPVSGKDGSLETAYRRFPKSYGFVKAKTGLLSNAAGLAGFAYNKRAKKKLTFVFIYNGSKVYDARVFLFDLSSYLTSWNLKI